MITNKLSFEHRAWHNEARQHYSCCVTHVMIRDPTLGQPVSRYDLIGRAINSWSVVQTAQGPLPSLQGSRQLALGGKGLLINCTDSPGAITQLTGA
jgi:hypothetical protein